MKIPEGILLCAIAISVSAGASVHLEFNWGNPLAQPKAEQSHCLECVAAMEMVKTWTAQANAQLAIKGILADTCATFPTMVQERCTLTMNTLVQVLEKGFDPKATCSKLALCLPQQDNRLTFKSAVGNTGADLSPDVALMNQGVQTRAAGALSQGSGFESGGDAECAMCLLLVAAVSEKLYSEEPKVVAIADVLCHDLPPPADGKCLAALDAEIPKIWKEIFEKATPKYVCELLTLCPA